MSLTLKLNLTMKKIEIEIPNGKRAEWVNGVLTLVEDDKNIQDIIDSLIIDECSNIRVFELGDEISNKYNVK